MGDDINLSPGEQVFVQDNEIINLAGVMGGESTKCKNLQLRFLWSAPSLILI